VIKRHWRVHRYEGVKAEKRRPMSMRTYLPRIRREVQRVRPPAYWAVVQVGDASKWMSIAAACQVQYSAAASPASARNCSSSSGGPAKPVSVKRQPSATQSSNPIAPITCTRSDGTSHSNASWGSIERAVPYRCGPQRNGRAQEIFAILVRAGIATDPVRTVDHSGAADVSPPSNFFAQLCAWPQVASSGYRAHIRPPTSK
jgi:hypothetical protein